MNQKDPVEMEIFLEWSISSIHLPMKWKDNMLFET